MFATTLSFSVWPQLLLSHPHVSKHCQLCLQNLSRISHFSPPLLLPPDPGPSSLTWEDSGLCPGLRPPSIGVRPCPRSAHSLPAPTSLRAKAQDLFTAQEAPPTTAPPTSTSPTGPLPYQAWPTSGLCTGCACCLECSSCRSVLGNHHQFTQTSSSTLTFNPLDLLSSFLQNQSSNLPNIIQGSLLQPEHRAVGFAAFIC